MATKKKGGHGGRRHGLSEAGSKTPPVKVYLSPEGRAKAERLAAARTRFADHVVTVSEVVRALVDEAPEPEEDKT